MILWGRRQELWGGGEGYTRAPPPSPLYESLEVVGPFLTRGYTLSESMIGTQSSEISLISEDKSRFSL